MLSQMICYRDKEWCSESHCANYDCTTNLTPEKVAYAQVWWNGNKVKVEDWTEAPIAFGNHKDTVNCPGYKLRP